MQLQFQITAEEIREYQKAHGNALSGAAGAKRHPVWERVRRWVGLAMMAGVAVVFVVSTFFSGEEGEAGRGGQWGYGVMPWLLVLIVVWFFFVRRNDVRYVFETARAAEKVGGGKKSGAAMLGWVLIVSIFVLMFVMFHQSAPVGARPAAVVVAPRAAGPDALRELLLQLSPWILIGGMVGWSIWRGRRRLAMNRAEMAAKMGYQTIEVTEAGVTMTTAYTRTQCEWLAFGRFCESENLFVLYLSNNTAYVMPKRALGSAADGEALRALAAGKIQPMTHGFPVEFHAGGQSEVQGAGGGG